jgi:hypothetical protein
MMLACMWHCKCINSLSNLQPVINKQMQKLELVTLLKKTLNKNLKPILNKQPNSYWPRTCITSLIPKLVLCIMTHIYGTKYCIKQ